MALKDAATHVDDGFTREGYRGMAFENAFGGALSFMRRKYSKDLTGVDLAVTGVPFDQAVTHRPGTRFGPRAIREASALQPMDAPYGWDLNPLTDMSVADYGDLAFDYADIPSFPKALTDHIAGILDAGAGSTISRAFWTRARGRCVWAVITISAFQFCAPMWPSSAR